MKKSLVMTVAMLGLGASLASAAAGINLSWNDCGTNGVPVATFNCASNSGIPFSAVASFTPPTGVDEFLGLSSQVDVTTGAPALPDWWKHGTTSCRGTSGLSVSFDFTSGPFSCSDFYVGAAAGGFAYDIGFGSPNRARLRIQCAVPFDNRGPVDGSLEYYAFKVNLQRAKSTGTGLCIGCSEPMCIVLNEVQLFQPPAALNDPQIFNPGPTNFVSWQSTVAGCPGSTPTHNTSWGKVKSLYR